MKTAGELRNEENIVAALESISSSLADIKLHLQGIEAVLDRGICVKTY